MRLQPHYFSGGMRQRCVLAIALALGPRILLADEPTTALDVTIQAQILQLIRQLQEEMGMAVIFITHDTELAAAWADQIYRLEDTALVEKSAEEVL